MFDFVFKLIMLSIFTSNLTVYKKLLYLLLVSVFQILIFILSLTLDLSEVVFFFGGGGGRVFMGFICHCEPTLIS